MMNIYNNYPDKENAMVGRPVVKGTDVDRVKRNLAMPLKQRNQLDNNANTPSVQLMSSRKCINSPVTELAYNFTELAAHETSFNNTPKRRLSLASSSGSPTPDVQRIQSLSSCTKSNNSSTASSNSDKGSVTKQLNISTRKALEPRLGQKTSAFRRFNSMPFGGVSSNEGSPQLYQSMPKLSLVSPLAQQHSHITSKPVFFVPEETCSHDSHDSGLGKDEGFKFVAPCIPPEKAQAVNETSPVRIILKKSCNVMGSPDLFDSMAQDSSDSPLLAHTLCSQSDEEVDDGFGDLDALERQCDAFNNVPDSIANMLTGKLMPSSSPCPVTDFRGSLFKSPSVPVKLNTTKSFDIRRRVLCAKRPEPPRDNTTPVAANKKRRSVVSDGNMPPVPYKLDMDSPATCSVSTRLQRCKSMVEHSATYELNKSQADTAALTGDFEKTCCLPLINGKHRDLKSISHDTMAELVNKEYEDKIHEYRIIDCRYPYEFDGGHIKGAENIYTKEDLYNTFLTHAKNSAARTDDRRSVLIFHCEFSSERAPKLSRFLRNHDRGLNKDSYPSLYYPEVYLLDGGYKVFYENHKDLCVPDTYKPMLHKDHGDDLKTFRAKSKSWAGAEKRGFRPGLMKRL